MPTDHSSFSSFLPPPNITGALHIGHSYNQVITDITFRSQRSRGCRQAYWFAGLDHAGIAAQLVVKTFLSKTKAQPLNQRSCLLESLWEWYYLVKETIRKQGRCIGVPLNWLRSYFTLSSKTSDLLKSVLLKLDKDRLIYRGLRLVNWDPVAGTVLSDLEVSYKNQPGHLWYIRFHSDSDGRDILVCTTRPETLFAVVAVAVNPEDNRYSVPPRTALRIPIVGRMVPLILSANVDSCFGSGAVKLVPSHCAEDLRSSALHNLEPFIILDSHKKLNNSTPPKYRNKSYETCKPSILLDLKFRGSIAYAVDHFITAPFGNRTGAAIEPLLTRQWFLSLSKSISNGTKYPGLSLSQIVLEVIRTKQVCFFPSKWKRACCDWLEIVEDWCLSRQLEWGHAMPSQLLLSDGNVLDTWFSSSAIPLSSVLQLPKGFKLSNIFPFSTLFTGFDILFFWVVRMLMVSLYCANKVPFALVQVHGLFCDEAGTKMSKSKGNVLDPKSFIAQNHAARSDGQGVDVLRTALASMATLNRHIMFDQSKFRGFGSFYLKIKNISKLISLRLEKLVFMPSGFCSLPAWHAHSFNSRWIMAEWHRFYAKSNKLVQRHRLDQLITLASSFVRRECCEQFIELIKLDESILSWPEKLNNVITLMLVFQKILRALYPFAPSVSSMLINNANNNFFGFGHHDHWPPESLLSCETKSLVGSCCNAVIAARLKLIELARTTKAWNQDVMILALGEKKIESLPLLKSLASHSKVLFFGAKDAIDFGGLSAGSLVCRMQLDNILFSVHCRPVVVDTKMTRCFKANVRKLLNLSYICSSNLGDIIVHLRKHRIMMACWCNQYLKA